MAAPELATFNAEHYQTTKADVVEIRYVWKIENILFLTEQDGVIISPIFESKHRRNYKWRLHMLRVDNNLVRLQPCLVSSDRPCIPCKFRCYVVNESGQGICSAANGIRHNMTPNVGAFQSPESMRSSNFAFNTDCSTINICFTIQMLLDIIFIPSKKVTAISDDSLQQQQDLSKLLETGQHSDVTLVVGGKEFRVHKAILSLRSAVFTAMFEHKDMEENKSNRVDITDFEHDVIKEMLQFIYAGICTSDMDKIALDLLAAADKYSLQDLKTMCGSVLEHNINVDSALKILIVADRHGVDRLKAQATKFIKANISNILKTEEWQTFYNDYSHLVMEMLGNQQLP